MFHDFWNNSTVERPSRRAEKIGISEKNKQFLVREKRTNKRLIVRRPTSLPPSQQEDIKYCQFLSNYSCVFPEDALWLVISKNLS